MGRWPGELLLFVRMRARFTEEISKKKTMPILKHQACIIVGWELHPIDRKTDSHGERKLDYLPLVIYVQVPKATWRVHAMLDTGVFPLQPITREWTINDATGSKASRRGFPLVPDFASTAFMNQGATLDAEIEHMIATAKAGAEEDALLKVTNALEEARKRIAELEAEKETEKEEENA